jgi:hypothetical protein
VKLSLVRTVVAGNLVKWGVEDTPHLCRRQDQAAIRVTHVAGLEGDWSLGFRVSALRAITAQSASIVIATFLLAGQTGEEKLTQWTAHRRQLPQSYHKPLLIQVGTRVSLLPLQSTGQPNVCCGPSKSCSVSHPTLLSRDNLLFMCVQSQVDSLGNATVWWLTHMALCSMYSYGPWFSTILW